jgi:rod shape determining protein RodA
VILEEFGFIGALVLIALYLTVILCGLGIAARTREPFGRLVVVGLVGMFATQVFVNMGMNVGLMPITGLTLPFISYGGSSLLASFIGLGIIMNVAVHPVMSLSRDDF